MLPEPYRLRLGASQPLDRQGEIRAGERIEAAYDALLSVLLDAGEPLDEVARVRQGLKDGSMDVADVVRSGEPADDRARGRLLRGTATALRLEHRIAEIRARLRSRKERLGARKRDALRAELAEALSQRKRTVERMRLHRDRIEAAVASARAAGLPRPVRRRLARAAAELGEAKRELTEANLRLVVLFARKHVGRGVALADLVQEGNLALMRAVDKFDHRVGTRFSTYAAWWIRQALARAVIGQSSDVRLSVHTSEAVRRTLRVAGRLSHSLGRDATPQEIAEEMGCPSDQVRRVLETHPRTVSMQTPLGDEGDRQLGDLLADEDGEPIDDSVAAAAEHERMLQLLSGLDPREQLILRQRFGIGTDGGRDRTLQEIGEEISLSRERVRQIEAEALAKLRSAILAEREGRSAA